MKYFVTLILTAAILLLSVPFAACAAVTAEDITSEAEFFRNGQTLEPKKMLDNDYYTVCSFKEKDELKITSKREISSLYIIFETEPKPYSVESGEIVQNCGEFGFLHEAVTLEAPSNEVKITMPKVGICQIYIFSEGDFPDFVQQWTPVCTECDILLFPTHADDELLFFGSIIPTYCAERGYKVQVAYMTRHYGRKERSHELLNGLWVIGAQNYPIYSTIQDQPSRGIAQAKSQYSENQVLEHQVSVIRRCKPKVIVGHDFQGEYGHGMHMFHAECLPKAIKLAGDEKQYPKSAKKYGVHDVQKLYVHLYDKNKITLDADSPLKAFGGKTAYEMAVLGFDEHKSQHEYGDFSSYSMYDLRKFGLYYSTVGADTGNDLLENINSENGIQTENQTIKDRRTLSAIYGQKQISLPEKGSNLPLLSIISVGGSVLIFAVIIIVIIHKKKKRNKDERNKSKYQK